MPKNILPIAIIGGGPAGLMAAEIVATAGHAVTVYDHKPTMGRKFLMAGVGGLNLTNNEPLEPFIERYGAACERFAPLLRNFPPAALRAWCEGLGQETFVGTSGRVFPVGMKATPLLRTWLHRLDKLGVQFKPRHRWIGWDDSGALLFSTTDHASISIKASAVLLALGGASWPHLGSDGNWVALLEREGVPIAPLRPANCGFIVPWPERFSQRHAGQPLKPVTITFAGKTLQGEAMVTAQGLEGGVIYALSSRIRDTIAAEGAATLTFDLRPGLTLDDLTQRLMTPRGSQSLSNFLRKTSGLSPVAIGLVQEAVHRHGLPLTTSAEIAALIKATPVQVTAPAPLERAISTAGGIRFNAVNDRMMLKDKAGVFVAGEMLDWEAPTGGYLLQGTFSTAVTAAQGMVEWLKEKADDLKTD